jgi:antagonist of KipI
VEKLKKPLFKIEKKGLKTSFQDLGRYGYQQYGVVVSGAMDPYALQIGNILVGNKRGEAGIEMTMIGPDLIALSTATISVCGADLSLKLNGQTAPMWKSFMVNEGDRITFGKPNNGLVAYLTVRGGFDIPIQMGSKSSYTQAGIGQTILNGDIIGGFSQKERKVQVGLPPTLIPKYEKEATVKVVPGPHCTYFTDEGLKVFLESIYTVEKGDRMGLRLNSDRKITHKNGADIFSDAIPFGAIQVPANGQPIILMADRQTTGGYTRIGTVISSDLSKVAQLPPGGKIRFVTCTVEQAQKIYIERHKQLKLLEAFR